MADALPISVQDALWLNMDRPNNLMHIDSVMWFRSRPDWDAVRAVVQERMVDRFPVFSSLAAETDDGYAWVPDPDFSLDHHVMAADLPAPVSVEAVQEYLAAIRSRPFDRARPLWEFYLIDHVQTPDGDDGGAAMVCRFHHAIADGIRLVQVILGLCDPVDGDAGVAADVGRGRQGDPDAGEPAGAGGPVGAAIGAVAGAAGAAAGATAGAAGAVRDAVTKAAGAGGYVVGRAAGTVGRAITDPAGTAAAVPGAVAALPGQAAAAVTSALGRGQEVLDGGVDLVTDPAHAVDAFTAFAPLPDQAANTAASMAKLAFSGTSVETVWSGTPGVDKTAHWAPAFPLSLVKEVGRATGTTVNDVLLAVVAGALSRYLADHGTAVAEVMWMIPVSLKPFDPAMPRELGNHFALLAFEMPLDLDDPAERLAEVHRRIERIKHSQEAVITFGVQRVISQTPERVGVFLTNFFANKAVGVLTNVPGPRGQVALAGTPVDGVLGWAPSSGDQPMTICIFTYNGRVHVGFGADATLVPDAGRLPEHFVAEALDAYERVMGHAPVLDEAEASA